MRDDIIGFLNECLTPEQFKDFCPNGLQIEGKSDVSHLVTGVTACQALLDKAVEIGADMVLVHHGLFWNGDSPLLKGILKHRCATALANDLSVVAYHLPLDVHPIYGNNVCLAAELGITITSTFPWTCFDVEVGNIGTFDQPITPKALIARMTHALHHAPLHIPGHADEIQTVAWCTGAAQGGLQTAVDCGIDAYISGEISEHTVHLARETGCHYFAAGHHATEQFGVQAIGELLAQQFKIDHTFVNIPNPV